MKSRSLGMSCAIAFFVAGIGTNATLASTVPRHPAAHDSFDAFGGEGRPTHAHAGIHFRSSGEDVRASCRGAFNAPDDRARSGAKQTRLPVSSRGVYGRSGGAAAVSGGNDALVSEIHNLPPDAVCGTDALVAGGECRADVNCPPAGVNSRPAAADAPGLLRFVLEFRAQLVSAGAPRRPILLMLASGLIGWLGIGRRRGVQLQERNQPTPRADTAASV